MRLAVRTALLLFALGLSGACYADTPTPKTVDFSAAGLLALDTSGPSDKLLQGGSILSLAQARIVITELAAQIQKVDPACDSKKSSFVLNVVTFADSTKSLLDGFSSIGQVKTSNWYVYDGHQQRFSGTPGSNLRVYGSKTPYLIVIHINSNRASFNATGAAAVSLKYQYTVTPRKAANLQDLMAALSLFQSLTTPETTAALAPDPVKDFWTWSSLDVDAPAGVAIGGAISPADPTKAVTLDKTPAQIDDEGFYHWDVSIGIPITSYTQIQTINPDSSSPPVPANIDKRNMMVLADWYIKPIDLQAPGVGFATPYLVGGVSFASKPLHNAMAGVGFGFNSVAVYVGTMFVTSNLPDDTKKTNIKLAFGLNLPIRTVMGKLGINTQLNAGP